MAATLQYINADYTAQRDALIARMRAEYPGRWNDFSASNFGQMLLELVAFNFTTLSYTINRLAGEQFLSTATLRESVARLGTLVDYQLRTAVPSTIKVSAAIPTPVSSAVKLVAGTQIRTGDAAALQFELVQDYTIEAGATTPSRLAATFDPALVGPTTVQALLSFTAGSTIVDCLDSTIDLGDFIEAGQYVIGLDADGDIASLVVPAGGVSRSRMQLSSPWSGATAVTTATVVDRRVDFVQGVTQQDLVNLPSSGLSGYYLALSQTGVIGTAVEVSVNGAGWMQVRTLVDAARDQPVYAVSTLPNGLTVVQFGNGQFGRIPPSSAIVSISYRTGGGISGNVAPGAISTSIIGLVTATSNPVTVQIANAQPGTGGLDAETTDEARSKIPAYTRALGQAVTLENYATVAMSFTDPRYGSVRYARAATRGGNSLVEGNIVYIYAWTTGASGSLLRLNSAFKQAVAEYVQARAVGTDYVVVEDGDEFALPYSARFLALPGYSVPALESLLLDRLTSYVSGLTPGAKIEYGDVFSELISVPGIDNIVVATPTADIPPPTPQAVFTPPVDGQAVYPIVVAATVAAEYTFQSQVVPLTPWCFELRLDAYTVKAAPGTKLGTAVLSGAGITSSSVNLATGVVLFTTQRQFSSVSLVLKTIQGYVAERRVDFYITVSGDSTLTKRREIRTVLRAWLETQSVGASVYATDDGTVAGRVSARQVVAAVDGVASVIRAAFDSPSSTLNRIDVPATTRLTTGAITINNYTD